MKAQRFGGILLLTLLLAGCVPDGGGTPPTTVPGTGHVVGLTENRYCAGPVSSEGCTRPFTAGSDLATVSIATVPVLKVQSADNGVFTVDLAPGT